MIDKRGIVGTGTQCADAQVGPLLNLLLLVWLIRLFHLLFSRLVVYRWPAIRIGDITSHFMHKAFKGVGPRGAIRAFSITVAIDVYHRLLLQFCGMVLNPLGRTEQALLFPVPRGQNDGALGPPPLLKKLAQGAGLFQERDHSAYRARGSVPPCIVVIPLEPTSVREGG